MHKRYVLSNGLRVIFEQIPYVRSVSVGVWAGVGSRSESAETMGISHFAEHMLFKGTEERTAKDIAEEMDSIGGQINAFTGRECTCYYTKTLDTHLETAVGILADMYLNSKLAPADIELERGVILEEIAMYEDSPEDLAHDNLSLAAWGDNPLGFQISGTRESVESISRERLFAFVKKYYTAKNTVISVAGSFDEGKLLSLIEQGLSAALPGEDMTDFSPAVFKPGSSQVKKDIEQAHLCLAFNGIKQHSAEIYALAVLNNIFGSGMSSRLFQNVRENRGIAYSIYSGMDAFKNAGMFSIYAGLNPGKLELTRGIILDEIEALKKSGITEYELKKGVEQLKGNYIMSLENISSRMSAIGKNELLFGLVRTPDEILALIDEVDFAAVENVINLIFSGDFAQSIVLGQNA